MSTESVPVTIQILDKEYMVSCPPNEKDALMDSARLLNARMQKVRDSGKVLGTERMAVITALNVIHEFARQQITREQLIESLEDDLHRLEEKVRTAVPRRAAPQTVD